MKVSPPLLSRSLSLLFFLPILSRVAHQGRAPKADGPRLRGASDVNIFQSKNLFREMGATVAGRLLSGCRSRAASRLARRSYRRPLCHRARVRIAEASATPIKRSATARRFGFARRAEFVKVQARAVVSSLTATNSDKARQPRQSPPPTPDHHAQPNVVASEQRGGLGTRFAASGTPLPASGRFHSLPATERE